MALYAVLGIGVGNLGHGKLPRRPMPKWVELLNNHLVDGTPPVNVIGFYGHTGNFLAESASADLDAVTDRFGNLLKTEWVVRPFDDVRAALTAVAQAPAPDAHDGVRWTVGVAFHGRAGVPCGMVSRTPRAVLWRVGASAIGVWKSDSLSDGGTLDRDRRGGGWGKISDDIETQIGGRWTARSCRTIAGLVRKATRANRDAARQPV